MGKLHIVHGTIDEQQQRATPYEKAVKDYNPDYELVKKKTEEYRKEQEKAKALYDKAIELLKQAADKGDDFAAMLYGIYLGYDFRNNCKEELDIDPLKAKKKKTEALTYLTYAATVPSSAIELASIIHATLMKSYGYRKTCAIPYSNQQPVYIPYNTPAPVLPFDSVPFDPADPYRNMRVVHHPDQSTFGMTNEMAVRKYQNEINKIQMSNISDVEKRRKIDELRMEYTQHGVKLPPWNI